MRELGKGNFATVKLAVHKQTEEKWAIKCIDKKKFMMNSASRKNNALMEEVIYAHTHIRAFRAEPKYAI